MVMDYVEGDTLAAVEGTAARLGRAIPLGVVPASCSTPSPASDAAHELKTPTASTPGRPPRRLPAEHHRRRRRNRARLTDFGIARAEQRIATTRTGMQGQGAPSWPRAVQEGRPVDPPRRCFAMGVTPGRPSPCVGSSPAARPRAGPVQHLRALPQAQGDPPSVPPALDGSSASRSPTTPSSVSPPPRPSPTPRARVPPVLATPRQVGSFMAAVAADKIQREATPCATPPSRRGARRPRAPAPARPATPTAPAAPRSPSPPPPSRPSSRARPPAAAPARAPPTTPAPTTTLEVAAALLALTEIPADRATVDLGPITPPAAAQAELPAPLPPARSAPPPPSPPCPVVEFGPPARAHHTPTGERAGRPLPRQRLRSATAPDRRPRGSRRRAPCRRRARRARAAAARPSPPRLRPTRARPSCRACSPTRHRRPGTRRPSRSPSPSPSARRQPTPSSALGDLCRRGDARVQLVTSR